ncbi:hypothetical protein [Thiomonas sp.]
MTASCRLGPERCSACLLQAPLPVEHPHYDQVYLLGLVTSGYARTQVSISHGMPTVAATPALAEKLGVPTVSDVRRGAPSIPPRHRELWLLSSGVLLLSRDGKLPLLRRDAGAPTAAGAWTEPAGRCDRSFAATGLNELNEELFLALLGPDPERQRVVAFQARGLPDALPGKELQRARVAERLVSAGHPGWDDLARRLKAAETTQWLLPEGSGLDELVLFHDGAEIERLRGASLLDRENHTLEWRLCYRLGLPADHWLLLDGEDYGREARWWTPGPELAAQPLTPALRYWLT